MKKSVFILLGAALLSVPIHGQDKGIAFQNTIKIEPGDSHEVIIEKAAHVIPTPNQLAALQNEYIAFIHFGPNTFTRKEWGNGMEDPKVFDLKNLDTDQWCEAMKAAGMKMVIFTAKHHDGFVLWQSRYTKHGIMSTNFREGKGDVLKDLSASCQKYGLKLGVYLSPADLFQIENPEGLYGNLSKYTKRTIPREVPGRPFANPTKFEFVVDDYNEYFLNQLFEVLTEYGPIHEVWFDGAHPKRKGGQTYNYHAWKELIHKLAPEAVIFGREGVRWCGNEAGGTRPTEFNVVPYPANPDTMSQFADMTDPDLGLREKLYEGKFLHYQQAETNTSIREGWFYRDDTHQKVRSADDVFDIYERAVGGNSTFLLNIPPNRDGKFSPADVESLKEAGKRIRETYGTNLLVGAKGPKEILDGKADTYLLMKDNEFTVTMPSPVTINRIMLQEAVATHSERVEKHAVDAWIDGAWKEIAVSTNIGYKRILRFPEVTTDKLRFRLLESRLTPAFSHISAHYYTARPPQLSFSRDINGVVTIEPKLQDFGWNSHGQNAAGNLNVGYKVYYTTDGSEPNAASTEYTAPVSLDRCELKAVAMLHGEKGAVASERLGLIKKDWKLLDAKETGLEIDLGKKQELNGISYTPQPRKKFKGGVTQIALQISDDGKQWQTVENVEFGNLVNDPTKRFHYFQKAVSARYVRIDIKEIAQEGKPSLDNWDLL